jgi:hypothetical protein
MQIAKSGVSRVPGLPAKLISAPEASIRSCHVLTVTPNSYQGYGPVPTRDRPAYILAGGRTSWLKEGPTLIYTRFTRYETRQQISFV